MGLLRVSTRTPAHQGVRRVVPSAVTRGDRGRHRPYLWWDCTYTNVRNPPFSLLRMESGKTRTLLRLSVLPNWTFRSIDWDTRWSRQVCPSTCDGVSLVRKDLVSRGDFFKTSLWFFTSSGYTTNVRTLVFRRFTPGP